MSETTTQIAQDIGALRRIDSETVREASKTVATGRVFDLGLEINNTIPNNLGFVRFERAFTATPEMTGMTSPFQASVEMIVGTLHVSTHIDALIHIQSNGRIYGGELAIEARDDKGWKKHGMETVPPIVGRGVFLDVARALGKERLPDRYEITIEEVQLALAASDQTIRQGDIVMVRTGKILQYGDPNAFLAEEPGVGREAAIWMYDQGMAALGTDTTGTEPVPLKDPANTTHRAMLVDRGVHLIENLYLEELAANSVKTGFFVGLPLKITGATGSWMRPVLIV
jgi:kynurenine formamidase